MDMELAGKRALVTGSNGGIGAGIAEMLAVEGVSVVLHGRNADKLERTRARFEAAGLAVATTAGDLSTDAGAATVAGAALDAFGGIDILVNNAGGASAAGSSFGSPHPCENVVGGASCRSRAPPGVIPTSAQPDYGPAKAGMVNMTVGLSKAPTGTGVTVNTVTPGMIMTDASARLPPGLRGEARAGAMARRRSPGPPTTS